MEFIHFLKSRQNRIYLIAALCGSIVLFTIFKILYPFPDFFSDSYSYIFAAKANLDINIWPIGYSKFLRWFHLITSSDLALISFQYFFYVLSSLYFFFTILHFYNPAKTLQVVLFLFLFFNPLFLYICNYVNSDPLFLALSLLWFTELLWIIHRPNLGHIIIQALLLFVAFTVRNNAYIYPILTAIAFIISRLKSWQKISGTALGLLFIIPFIIHTRNEAYKMTGVKQFSFFTGWQLANNALYTYLYADTAKKLSAEGRELEKLSLEFHSLLPAEFRRDYLLANPGNYFIQQSTSPLKLYFQKHYKVTDDYSNVVAWGQASKIYGEYGKYIIVNNKMAYFHEFMLPNAKNYFLPHLEKLTVYNLNSDNVSPVAKDWFHYSSSKVKVISHTLQGEILYIFPILFLLINIYFLRCLFVLWYRGKFKIIDSVDKQAIFLAACFFIINFSFEVFATIIVMRYQVFPMIISTTSSLLLMKFVDLKKPFTNFTANQKSQVTIG